MPLIVARYVPSTRFVRDAGPNSEENCSLNQMWTAMQYWKQRVR
jgi:hypothetical protein